MCLRKSQLFKSKIKKKKEKQPRKDTQSLWMGLFKHEKHSNYN